MKLPKSWSAHWSHAPRAPKQSVAFPPRFHEPTKIETCCWNNFRSATLFGQIRVVRTGSEEVDVSSSDSDNERLKNQIDQLKRECADPRAELLRRERDPVAARLEQVAAGAAGVMLGGGRDIRVRRLFPTCSP